MHTVNLKYLYIYIYILDVQFKEIINFIVEKSYVQSPYCIKNKIAFREYK